MHVKDLISNRLRPVSTALFNDTVNDCAYMESVMNKYGALVELYWQGKAEVFGEKRVPLTLCLLQVPLDWLGTEPDPSHKRAANERLVHDKALLI